jgi:hypothetical protein
MDQRADERHREVIQAIQALKGRKDITRSQPATFVDA